MSKNVVDAIAKRERVKRAWAIKVTAPTPKPRPRPAPKSA